MKLLILLALFCGAMAQNKDVPDPVKDINVDKGVCLQSAKCLQGEAQNGLRKNVVEVGYVFYSTPQTWANAQMNCLAMGGHLVVLNSKQEEDFVKGLSGGREIWIGLSDAQQFGSWFWINSEPLGYTNWCPGEPDKYGVYQQCGLTNYSDLKCWDDQECDTRHAYVCERKKTQA